MNMDLERLYFSQIILNGLVLPIIALLMEIFLKLVKAWDYFLFFR